MATLKTILKWSAIGIGGLFCLALLAGVYVYVDSSRAINRMYEIEPHVMPIPAADSSTLARGRHQAVIRGCVDCHGENLGGKIFIDDPAVGRIAATNLTSGTGGIGLRYSDQDWVRSIRHGVGPDGKPLLVMPANEFYYLGDEDLGALIGYLKQVPPVDSDLPDHRIGPMARLLYVAGQLPLVPAEMIVHEPPPAAPPVGATAAYGKYMAVTCTGCHGADFSGGTIPGVPPDWPPAANITPHPDQGIGSWTEYDFFRALRHGQRPDGSELELPYMPWNLTKEMTDTEIRAIWTYLQSIEPKAKSSR